jgi:hypothetical protein
VVELPGESSVSKSEESGHSRELESFVIRAEELPSRMRPEQFATTNYYSFVKRKYH